MKEKKKINWIQWGQWFLFAFLLMILFKAIDNFNEIAQGISQFFNILMPFLIAILIAYLLYVPSRKLENKLEKVKVKFIAKKARGISVIIIYILAIVLLFLAIRFLAPIIVQSLGDLIGNMQGYYDTILDFYNGLSEDSLLKNKVVTDFLNGLQNIDIQQYLNWDQLAQYAKGVMGVAGKVFDVFVSVIASIYILIERRQIIEFIRKIVKSIWGAEKCQKIGNYFHQGNEIFFRFVASQFLDAIVVGILTSVAMSILQVKYAVLLGFLIGIANMIPYFGAIFAVGLAIIITILTGGIGKAVLMGIVIIILQQIDANIINPKIVGNSLKISPLLVIFAVTIGGAYFGVMGMFLAVPIAAVIKIIVTDYIEEREK